jgi:hypothetical protein
MTELAVIEPEVVNAPEVVNTPEPLSEGKARVLDKQIRQAGARVATEQDKLIELLNKAATGQIHTALGYPSWPAYLKDAVSIVLSDREERKALASLMSGKGVSNRAVAAMLGVSEATVRRDTEGAEKPDTVEGLDGTPQPRKKRDDNVIDAEVVDDEPDDVERTPADVVEDFAAEVDTLLINVQAFKDILNDDEELLPKARKRLAQRFCKRLSGAISDLQSVVDELMG